MKRLIPVVLALVATALFLNSGLARPTLAAVGTSVSAGDTGTCAVLDDGTAKCWGIAAGVQHLLPTTVSGLSDAAAISVGSDHVCALIEDGTVECWGGNSAGQLGDGTRTDRNTPALVPGLDDVVAVATGGQFTCALLGDSSVRCWGLNSYGQLGDGTTTNRSSPVAVSGLDDVVAIDSGEYHACAVLNDGTAKCWGWNQYGQLGDGTTSNETTPVDVSGLNNAVNLVSGDVHTCALINDGTIECWGSNTFGQLGDGTKTKRTSPVTVSGIGNTTAVAAGFGQSCALLNDDTVKCWGEGGDTGDGTGTDRTTPVAVLGLSNVVSVSAGGYQTCALSNVGTARCWGSNSYGQLGIGETSGEMLQPMNVVEFPACVSPPDDHSAASTQIGSLPFADNFSTRCVAEQPYQPRPCGMGGSSVWYSYTPTVTGTLEVSTAGSDFDTVLAVYANSNYLACNDDSGVDLTSLVTFPAVAGTTYQFQVGGFAVSKGDVIFNVLAPSPTPPTPTPTSTATPCPPGACTPTPTPTATPTSNRPWVEASIDETVNGQQGPITVNVGDSITLRWVVTNLGPRRMDVWVTDELLPDLNDDNNNCFYLAVNGTCEKSLTVPMNTLGVFTNVVSVEACGIPPWPNSCEGIGGNDWVKVNVLDPAASTSSPAVGGIAEVPDDATTGKSTSSSTPFALLTGIPMAAAAAIGAGTWYARRRWRRTR
jgi:alpha-tubulin suppressor-like RCC1 family protein